MNQTKVTLKNVRLAFPRVTKPEQVQGEGKPAYSAAFILEADSPEFEANKAAIEAAMQAAAKDKWGQKADAMYKALEAKDKLALHDGDTKSDVDGYAGNMFINARSGSNAPPGLFRRDRTAIERTPNEEGVIPSETELYGGCYVNAIINVWAQDNNYGKRINASLAGIQYYREGVPFSGTAPASSNEFDEIDTPDGSEFDDIA